MRTPQEISNEIINVELTLEQTIAQLRREAQQKIKALRHESKKASQAATNNARQQILMLLAQHGLTVEAVLGNAKKSADLGERQRRPAAPPTVHYVGPDGQVWGGRGPRPVWIKGRDKKEFERPGPAPQA